MFILYAASFLAPIILVLASLLYLDMYPFGQENFDVWDARIIYTYSYEWYKHVLMGDGSIFYSFSKSLGGNTYAGFACLLVSPINLLIPLFGDNPVDFLTFQIITKFGLAGLSIFFYLSKRFNLRHSFALVLSTCYAMSLFVTSECVNPNWMEAVIILPMVMYGIYLIVNKGKFVLFFVTLLISILLDFYHGYMICLFSIMFYLFESYLVAQKAKKCRLKIMVNPGRFSAAFTLAILASAVILLPTVIELMGGKGAVPDGLFWITLRYSPSEILHAFYLGIYEKEHLPQFFAGTLTTIGTLWFFLNKNIDKRQRYAMGVLLMFMLLSTWYGTLDRIWLGLRDGNSFYCRFGFLITFLLIFCSATVLSSIDNQNKRQTLRSLMIATIVVAIGAFFTYSDEIYSAHSSSSDYHVYIPYLVASMVICVSLFLIIKQFIKGSNTNVILTLLGGVLAVLVGIEMIISCVGVFAYRASEELPSTYSRYQDYYTEGHVLMDELNAKDNSSNNAYRIEKTFGFLTNTPGTDPDSNFPIALNESYAFGYHGVQLYESTYDDIVQNEIYRLGYTPDSYNRTTFNDSMIVADSLLGIKYMVSDQRPIGYQDSDITSSWDGSEVYQNPYALPLGFGASKDVLETIEFGSNPFEYQNQLINQLTGEVQEYSVEAKTRLIYQSDDCWTWEIEPFPNKDFLLYGFVKGSDSMHLSLYDGANYKYNYLSEWSHGMFPVRTETADGAHLVSLKGNLSQLSVENGNDAGSEDPKPIPVLRAVYIDVQAFVSVIDELARHPFEIDVFEDGYVKGSYLAQSDELLFTTIPYDAGWTIKVNGEIVTPQIVQDTFIALDVQPGENQIEMSYLSPGFIPGLLISLVSCFVFALFTILVYRKDKASEPANCSNMHK